MFDLVRARSRLQRALRLWRAGQTVAALHHGERAVSMFAALAARRPGGEPGELVAAALALAGFSLPGRPPDHECAAEAVAVRVFAPDRL